jgi:hypothetical protein
MGDWLASGSDYKMLLKGEFTVSAPGLVKFEEEAGKHKTHDRLDVCPGTIFKLHFLGTPGITANIYKCMICEREMLGDEAGLLPREWEDR